MIQIGTRQPRIEGVEHTEHAPTRLYYHEIKEFLRWLGLSKADFCRRTELYHPDTLRRWSIHRHGGRVTLVVERQLRDYVDGLLGSGIFFRSVAQWQKEKPRYLRVKETPSEDETEA